MLLPFLDLLRCPVTGEQLHLEVISMVDKNFHDGKEKVVCTGILSAGDWVYPVIKGVPRLLVESFLEHEQFLLTHLPDYADRKKRLLEKYGKVLRHALKKNERTKQSFSQEWDIFNYQDDKVWALSSDKLLDRFATETAESKENLRGKMILDVGCGNGLLNQQIAAAGATIIGIDVSLSIERAFDRNRQKTAFFIQADMQHPPVPRRYFDIVHASGSLHHTNNTEYSFSCIEPLVKRGGKLSVWLYQPRKDKVHNIINSARKYTSRLPLKVQMLLYKGVIFPVSYVIKRIKKNNQNPREMMIDILDWFSPEFRWEHTQKEVKSWFVKHRFTQIKTTTDDPWGFNMIGILNPHPQEDPQSVAGKE